MVPTPGYGPDRLPIKKRTFCGTVAEEFRCLTLLRVRGGAATLV